MPTIPRLRQRLVRAPFGGGRPFWANDLGFDVRDMSTLTDGVGGLAVLGRLVDGAASVPDTAFPSPSPRRGALFLDASGTRLRALVHLPVRARHLRPAFAKLAKGGVAGTPRSSLNRPIGTHRTLAVARADLSAVQRLAHAHGATVNDVVLTAVTGALHAVRQEDVDRFVVSVPIAGRREATAGDLGTLSVTVIADPLRCPDLGVLLVRLQSELDLLTTEQTPGPASQDSDNDRPGNEERIPATRAM
jgi:diacylglycerol O-acyltransferase / wax synthase